MAVPHIISGFAGDAPQLSERFFSVIDDEDFDRAVQRYL
jgi:hypothetical protein